MSLEVITHSFGVWAYILLALFVMIEGPVVTLAGAVAAASGLMRPEGVFLAAASGNLLADSLWYGLGYVGKMEWLERIGRYVGVTSALVQRLRGDIEQHAARILFVTKLTLGFSIPALIATGLSRVPWRRWFPVLIIGETLWTGSLVLVGYYLTRYVQTLERGIEIATSVAVVVGMILLGFYLARLKKRSQADLVKNLDQPGQNNSSEASNPR